jgi:hypothetical protein
MLKLTKDIDLSNYKAEMLVAILIASHVFASNGFPAIIIVPRNLHGKLLVEHMTPHHVTFSLDKIKHLYDRRKIVSELSNSLADHYRLVFSGNDITIEYSPFHGH